MPTELTLPNEYVKFLRIYVRSNSTIPWWTTITPESVKQHYQSVYIDTGKLIEEWTESEDGLTLNYRAYYLNVNPQDYSDWKNDSIVQSWITMREDYCVSSGIAMISAITHLVINGVETEIDLP
jgi:hypothetical protein